MKYSLYNLFNLCVKKNTFWSKDNPGQLICLNDILNVLYYLYIFAIYIMYLKYLFYLITL